MGVDVRVDVSANNPISRYAKEQSLERLFQMQAISFEEYVQSLDDDSAAPKGKLLDILDKRQAQAQMQEQMQAQAQAQAQAAPGPMQAGADEIFSQLLAQR